MAAFTALAGAVLPSLVGGLMNRNDQGKAWQKQKKLDKKNYLRTQRDRKEDRAWFVEDRSNDRDYAAGLLRDDRAYAEERLYDDRRYLARVTDQDREYLRGVTEDDRAYAAQRLADDRAYSDKARVRDRDAYIRDRQTMQNLADVQAERNAASRGIDFVRLRDDAIKAGFNPLTAMNMAHAYSTEVGYANVGSVYTGDANYFNSGAGYNAGTTSGGGSQTATGTVPASGGGVAPGGFQTNGGGYSTTFNPQLSSAGFIAEALQRGVDTWFNTQDEKDVIAQNVAEQVRQSVWRREQEAALRKEVGFGYDLTKIQPYHPTVSVSTGALSAGGPSPSDPLAPVSKQPLMTPWGEFKPRPGERMSDAAAWEERYSDIPSAVASTIQFGSDVAYNLDKQVDRETAELRRRGRSVLSGLGSYVMTGVRPYLPEFSKPWYPNSASREW